MVADEAGLELGGMLDNVGAVSNTVPERKLSSSIAVLHSVLRICFSILIIDPLYFISCESSPK